MPARLPFHLPFSFGSGSTPSTAVSLSEWYVSAPGEDFARIESDEALEGDAFFVLGSLRGGVKRLVAEDDRIDLYQTIQTSGDADLVAMRFLARLRGPETMPALSGVEPFALADGQTLTVKIDHGAEQTFTIDAGDFDDVGAATALEVARAMNRDLTSCRAYLTGTGEVALFSLKTGRRSYVEITGGTAAGLDFARVAWRAALLLDSAEVAGVEIRNGVDRAPLDFAANLTPYGGADVEVRFRLEVVRV